MPFFGSKLSEEQKRAIQELVHRMNELNTSHTEAFDAMQRKLQDLYVACRSARQSGLGGLPTVNDVDLNMAREVLTGYQAHIDTFAAELGTLHVEDWFPKKLKRSLADASKFLESERSTLTNLVMEALSLPLPLVDQLGKAKLNMFVSGLDMTAIMVRAFRSPIKA